MSRSRSSRATRQPSGPTPIESLRHGDKRANIPTEELRDFVADDERTPKTLLYPRDPSLDPQMVWKGKDEQDAADLAVPAVPIYIQEKIDPRAIVEDVRRTSAPGPQPAALDQLSLFADFDGAIEFDELVEFYQHEQNWSNRMILGDSLLVMASLAEKEGLKGKVQTIYLDPPYGIKFGSNWQVSTRKRDVKDGRREDVSPQPEQIKAFRDTWQLGIHSYLTYLRDRLTVARDLLTESGSMFVQIGDENVHLVRSLLDEVFGSENFVTMIAFNKTWGFSGSLLSSITDHVLWYGKRKDYVKYRQLYRDKTAGDEGGTKYRPIASISSVQQSIGVDRPDRLARLAELTSQGGPALEFEFHRKVYRPAANSHWKTTIEGLGRLAAAQRISVEGRSLAYLRYLDDFGVYPLANMWTDIGGIQSRSDPKVYVVQTATSVIERCLLMTTDPGDLVLDPTCGSGTTAYVAEQWGRRWITVDTSRVALALARTRLMSGRFPYYLLADSPEGREKESEISGVPVEETTTPTSDVRKGFVYRRVPHITLKSIANNPEIDEIHARYQARMEPLRAEINSAARASWEEWEMPRTLDGDETTAERTRARTNTPSHNSIAKTNSASRARLAGRLQQWWESRRERQREIDASIARRADTEILYDQPYEDNKRIRVTGPFTVESLSPHRVLSTDEDRPQSEIAGQRDAEAQGGGFVPMILDNLRKAGVQNTVRNERLKLDHLEPFAGQWIQASGEYTDSTGSSRRIAITIGPEHGTVGPDVVKEAAKEAMRGAGFDLLIVCGFAFDAHAGETAREFAPSPNGHTSGDGFVAEETRQYGRLPVMLARMNPDLAMGEDLLKNTGAGNLFMVFGEPDIDIQRGDNGQITVEVRGVDVYDPTTGAIRSSSTDDIACWFIDTGYNEESFFVRHAYFTGADEPYDKLKRALRAEIDESAWAALYSTTSRPFDAPATGRIAVKVINHYGDEVIKVYEV